jgi:hypothetical protein
MFRWLAAVITILVVTLGAWAPTQDQGWPPATTPSADRDALDLDFEDPEPETKATLCSLLTPAPPAPRLGAAIGSHHGPRDGAALELEEPPRA